LQVWRYQSVIRSRKSKKDGPIIHTPREKWQTAVLKTLRARLNIEKHEPYWGWTLWTSHWQRCFSYVLMKIQRPCNHDHKGSWLQIPYRINREF
jgi:hypothetical protein